MPVELYIREQVFSVKAQNFEAARLAIVREMGMDDSVEEHEERPMFRDLLWMEGCISDDAEYAGGDLTELDFHNRWPQNWDYIARAIAPYVEPGSYLIVESEGNIAKWEWRDGKFFTIPGEMVFKPF